MKKLAIYSRTSTDKQEKGLEAQQRSLREWAKYNQHDDYLEFADEGISGMKSSRPQFDRMLEAVKAGQVHTVLVYSFSRFARSTKQLIEALDFFRREKVSFVSFTEKIDTSTPMGKVVFTIIAALAEFERDLIAERVKNGLKNAKAKGVRLGRRPTAMKKAERIRELAAQGMEIPEIARETGVSRASVYRALGKLGKRL